MSRRTAASNKAIRDAWKNEQNLVKEGKGTRDWTIDQQKDILERGKAYDENGKAFEGQHMRSAEVHPECQGDPKNIQFLTRAEHLDAHDGNWKNPTNWYYNPVTKEKTGGLAMLNTNITNFRKNIFGMLEQTIKFNTPVTISTKDGNAVVISEDDYNNLVETLYLSSVPGVKEKIIEGLQTPVDDCVAEEDVRW